jgi:hypothetical protein
MFVTNEDYHMVTTASIHMKRMGRKIDGNLERVMVWKMWMTFIPGTFFSVNSIT